MLESGPPGQDVEGFRAKAEGKILESENANGPLRAAGGPPEWSPTFSRRKNEIEGRPRGARGRPREAPGPPKTLRNLKKPSKNYVLVVPFRSLLGLNRANGPLRPTEGQPMDR